MKLTKLPSVLAISACLLVVAGCTDTLMSPAIPLEPSLSATASGPADNVPTYSQERPGTFVDMPDSLLWQHIEYSGQVAVVGLRRPGANRGVYRGRILMDRSQWEQSRHAVTSRPGVELVWADTLLPTVKVRFSSFEAFHTVRGLPVTDYIEPLRAIGDIPSRAEGSLGCHSKGEWKADRLYTSEGDVYSLHHRAMGIEAAWQRTSGAGVNVGLIDTGVDAGQRQLLPSQFNGYFNTGASAERWYKFRDAWNGNNQVNPSDDCQHGTQAAGVIAAPRDGRGPVGVAWGSNLVATRIANGVVNVNADDAEHGIRNTLSAMEGEPGPKIISMSWQSLNWYWQVSNEIDHWQSRYPNELLFFGAAGTAALEEWQECGAGIGGGTLVGGAATWIFNPYVGAIIFLAGAIAGCEGADNDNVVFPAQHHNVIAVTCIDYGSGDVSNNCHFGSKVEFSAYQGFPTVYGDLNWVDQLGGSSGATPTVAGQAALVWSRYPWMTRAQVLDRMRWASTYNSNRNSRQGYGIVNSHKAAGGMYAGRVDQTLLSGGGFNQVAHYELRAVAEGGDGPFSFRWDNGETTPTRSVDVGPGDPTHVYTVTITDASDGTSVHGRIDIPPPPGGCADPSQVECGS